MGKTGTTFTVATEADKLEAAIAAAGLDNDQAEQVFDVWVSGGYAVAKRRITTMALTPEQVARLTPGQRADYERVQAERQQAREQEAAAFRALEARREASQRDELRKAWQGDDASFERAYPRLLEEYRTRKALDTVSMPQNMRPKVRL